MNTIQRIRSTIPSKKDRYHIWLRFVLRPLSVIVAWFFLKSKMQANYISYLSALICLTSAIFITTGEYLYMVFGAIGFNLFALLDCVDGNIARYKNQASPFGEWADALGGYFASALVLPSVGIAVGLGAENEAAQIYLIGLGVLAGILNILSRIIQKKYQEIRSEKIESFVNDKKSVITIVERNMGITGFLMPSVLVGVLTGYLIYILIFFSIYYIFGSLFYIVYLIYRVEQEKKVTSI